MSKVVLSAVFPSSFSIFMGFLLGLVLTGRLNPSDSPLLLVTLVSEDMTVYNKNERFYTKCMKFYFGNLFHGKMQ